jgi:hypothetical protein
MRSVVFALPFGALLCLAYAFGPPASRIDYMAAVRSKHERLDDLPSPKAIIIGGSNGAFGIDSERLERALCMPVANMTIHASLGFRFMVEEIKGSLGEGDLIIATIEHSGYDDPQKYTDAHILTVDRAPGMVAFLPWYERPRVLLGVAVMRLHGIWKIWTGAWKNDTPHSVYRASGFNDQGDLVSHLNVERYPVERQSTNPRYEPGVARAFWPIVDELADSLAKYHASMVFVWPAVAQSSANPPMDRSIALAMEEHGQTMLGRAEDYIYPDTTFHDSHHHLRAPGRQIRTTRLINDLCSAPEVSCCRTP